jgi:HAD superfamily phosphoserine phosphatase-like hydrolase
MSISQRCEAVAVFDVDGTLIKDNIGVTFVKFLNEAGHIRPLARTLISLLYPMYKLRLLDFKYAILMGAWAVSGLEASSVGDLAKQCFDRDIKQRIYADGIAEIEKCRSEGQYIILATGAHEAIAHVLGAYLKADAVVATESEATDGNYTMRVKRPLPYRDGKRDLVFALIERQHPNAVVTVYTDEKKDLPLLAHADKYVGVNADQTVKDFVASNGGVLRTFG